MATNLDVVAAPKLELAVTHGLYVDAVTMVPNLNIPVLPEMLVAGTSAVYVAVTVVPELELASEQEKL